MSPMVDLLCLGTWLRIFTIVSVYVEGARVNILMKEDRKLKIKVFQNLLINQKVQNQISQLNIIESSRSIEFV